MRRSLQHPFTAKAVRKLAVGDTVMLSGQLITGRDRFHKYLFEGGRSPVDLKDACIYHCGPVVMRTGDAWLCLAAGPTTSAREEPFMAQIIEQQGIRVVLGKGGMGEATRRACMKCGCVYLQAVGGAGSLAAAKVTDVVGVHLVDEFGLAEAVWVLNVKNLEAVVTIDTHGRSLHRRVESSSRRVLRALLKAR